MAPKKNPDNLRLALIIGAIALFFFAMVFVKRLWHFGV